MQVFSCSNCHIPVFFENFACTGCGAKLAFLPEHRVMSVMELAVKEPPPAQGERPTYVAMASASGGASYRMCRNSDEHAACNWAVPVEDNEELCRACRLNGIIPAISDPHQREGWLRLEAAKRHLMYSLLSLGLPIESRKERPNGLEFAFKADSEKEGKVFTGHSDGLITINVAEADEPFREKIRRDLGEAYRTLLGHFRHEIGHYYWDRLINGTPRLDGFRELFGDETADYAAAMARHYKEGAPPGWPETFVSAYATMHPWEDWAETWAHYLHMIDTLETARSYGLSLKPTTQGGEQLARVTTRALDTADFDALVAAWVPVTLALNSLNRSMGLSDPYPFVLTPPVLVKLRFVHDIIVGAMPRAAARPVRSEVVAQA